MCECAFRNTIYLTLKEILQAPYVLRASFVFKINSLSRTIFKIEKRNSRVFVKFSCQGNFKFRAQFRKIIETKQNYYSRVCLVEQFRFYFNKIAPLELKIVLLERLLSQSSLSSRIIFKIKFT